jgi:hypothetical protein
VKKEPCTSADRATPSKAARSGSLDIEARSTSARALRPLTLRCGNGSAERMNENARSHGERCDLCARIFDLSVLPIAREIVRGRARMRLRPCPACGWHFRDAEVGNARPRDPTRDVYEAIAAAKGATAAGQTPDMRAVRHAIAAEGKAQTPDDDCSAIEDELNAEIIASADPERDVIASTKKYHRSTCFQLRRGDAMRPVRVPRTLLPEFRVYDPYADHRWRPVACRTCNPDGDLERKPRDAHLARIVSELRGAGWTYLPRGGKIARASREGTDYALRFEPNIRVELTDATHIFGYIDPVARYASAAELLGEAETACAQIAADAGSIRRGSLRAVASVDGTGTARRDPEAHRLREP